MSFAHPLCPRLLAAFNAASATVIGLVLGLVPFKGSKAPFDLVFVNLVLMGEQTCGAIPLGLLHGDDLPMRGKAALALEAILLRALAEGVTAWLFVGGPAERAVEIPGALLPDDTTVELLAALVEHRGSKPDDPVVLGQAALARWNLILAFLSEPQVWGLVHKVVEILLATDKISRDQIDNLIDANGELAELLNEYQEAVADVLRGWHRGALSAGMEVAS